MTVNIFSSRFLQLRTFIYFELLLSDDFRNNIRIYLNILIDTTNVQKKKKNGLQKSRSTIFEHFEQQAFDFRTKFLDFTIPTCKVSLFDHRDHFIAK